MKRLEIRLLLTIHLLCLHNTFKMAAVIGKTGGKDFDPAKDLPSLAGKVLLVTGGTAGLGRGAVLALAKAHPAEIIFSGRNQKNADALIAEAATTAPGVPVRFLMCDLASLESVRAAAHSFLEGGASRLDVLMCNAGIMGTAPGVTKDGYEVQFGTNHMGHALLIKLLSPLLERTAAEHGDARILLLSSTAYHLTTPAGIEFDTLKSAQTSLGPVPLESVAVWHRYGQSKLANLLYAKSLATRLPTVTTVAVHPGVIKTGLFDAITSAAKPGGFIIANFSKTTPVERGHFNQVWAATCPKDELVSGDFYVPVGTLYKPSMKVAKDNKLEEKLWDWTQKELEAYE